MTMNHSGRMHWTALLLLLGMSLVAPQEGRAAELREVRVEKEMRLMVPEGSKVELRHTGPDFVVYAITLGEGAGLMLYLGDHPDFSDLKMDERKEVRINGMPAGMWLEKIGASVRGNIFADLPPNVAGYRHAHFFYQLPAEYAGQARSVCGSLLVVR